MPYINYCIKEKAGTFNFSRTYNKKKLYSSHGQGYTRKLDGLKVFRANFKGSAKVVDVTRAEFEKLFSNKKKK